MKRIKCWLAALSSISFPQILHMEYKTILTILCNTAASVFKVPLLRSSNQVQKVGGKYLLVNQSPKGKEDYIKEGKNKLFSLQKSEFFKKSLQPRAVNMLPHFCFVLYHKRIDRTLGEGYWVH